ncbi:unnamed protein product, partial [Staurois parvus]
PLSVCHPSLPIPPLASTQCPPPLSLPIPPLASTQCPPPLSANPSTQCPPPLSANPSTGRNLSVLRPLSSTPVCQSLYWPPLSVLHPSLPIPPLDSTQCPPPLSAN